MPWPFGATALPPVQERRDSEKGARGRISVSSTSAVFTGHLRLMFRAHHDSIENDQALQACVQWWPHSMPHYCKHQLCWNHTPRTASHRQHNSSPPPSHSFFSGTSQHKRTSRTHTHEQRHKAHSAESIGVVCVQTKGHALMWRDQSPRWQRVLPPSHKHPLCDVLRARSKRLVLFCSVDWLVESCMSLNENRGRFSSSSSRKNISG